jgi:hypothetical protein
MSGWREFGHDLPTIGHENGFARLHPSEVLAKTVLEFADAYRSHHYSVATRGYIVNRSADAQRFRRSGDTRQAEEFKDLESAGQSGNNSGSKACPPPRDQAIIGPPASLRLALTVQWPAQRDRGVCSASDSS